MDEKNDYLKNNYNIELSSDINLISQNVANKISSYDMEVINEMSNLFENNHHLKSSNDHKYNNKSFFIFFSETLAHTLYSDDPYLFRIKLDEYYNSSEFKSLDANNKKDIVLLMETTDKLRIKLINHIHKSRMAFRMSPGDRMVWSGTISQLNEDQVKAVMDATVTGIGMAISKGTKALAMAWTVVSNLF